MRGLGHAVLVAAAVGAAAGAGLGALLVSTAGCSSGENDTRLVIYASADEPVARAMVHAFEASTGTRTILHLDTEATKTFGLADRLRRERDAPRADVFWSSENAAIERLAVEGVVRPLPESVARDWPAEWLGEQHRWAAFGGRLRVLVWRVGDARALPESMEALPRALGQGERVALADPRFGTTRGHVEALAATLVAEHGAEAWGRWCEHFASTAPLILSGGNAAVVDAVAAGDAVLGVTDTDDALAAMDAGRPIDFRPIGLIDSGGACGALSGYLIPNTIGLIANGPHPAEAEAFAAFVLSEAGEQLLAESASANIPLGSATHTGRVPRPSLMCSPRASEVSAALSAVKCDAVAVLLRAVREGSHQDNREEVRADARSDGERAP